MSPSQNDSGRAFEYGLALSLSRALSAPMQSGSLIQTAQACFDLCPDSEQRSIVQASNAAAAFLLAHDRRLSGSDCVVRLQSDQRGQEGDVRDIVVHNAKRSSDVGISAKNRHFAVKHSRLSARINFGLDWFGIPCSPDYLRRVTPLFQELDLRRLGGEKWADISDKRQRYYVPVLQAFQDETHVLSENHPQEVARGLLHYLLGKFDYYKVVKENGTVSIMSFNITGSLQWGRRVPLPSRVIEISQKPGSDTTIFMTFDHGWQISFRIHNASTWVEPSLKFDINIVGWPQMMSKHVDDYHHPQRAW